VRDPWGLPFDADDLALGSAVRPPPLPFSQGTGVYRSFRHTLIVATRRSEFGSMTVMDGVAVHRLKTWVMTGQTLMASRAFGGLECFSTAKVFRLKAAPCRPRFIRYSPIAAVTR